MAGHNQKVVEDPDDQIASLRTIVEKADELDGLMDSHLVRWPSARVANSRPRQLVAAMQREIDAIEFGKQVRATRDARSHRHQEQREYSQFEQDMAAKLDITPAEFVARQAEQRKAMERGTRLEQP